MKLISSLLFVLLSFEASAELPFHSFECGWSTYFKVSGAKAQMHVYDLFPEEGEGKNWAPVFDKLSADILPHLSCVEAKIVFPHSACKVGVTFYEFNCPAVEAVLEATAYINGCTSSTSRKVSTVKAKIPSFQLKGHYSNAKGQITSRDVDNSHHAFSMILKAGQDAIAIQKVFTSFPLSAGGGTWPAGCKLNGPWNP